MSTAQPVFGWPFLVARGRQRGYTVLLAPDFLVANREYGFLEELVGPTRQDTPMRTAGATTPGGRRVCLVWTEYRVQAADLHDGSLAVVDPVDEHSRPLRLLHGFLCAGGQLATVAPTDLDHAHDIALEAYRRFLADEDGFRVLRSAAFPVSSTLAGQAPPERRSRPEIGHRRIVVDRKTVGIVALTAVLTALILLLGIMFLGGNGSGNQQPTVPTTTLTPTVPTTATFAGTGPQLSRPR